MHLFDFVQALATYFMPGALPRPVSLRVQHEIIIMLAPILSFFFFLRKIHPASLGIMLGHEHNFEHNE